VTVDLNALALLLVGALLVGGVRMLLNRLTGIEASLEAQGRKLVRIETTLNIKEHEI